MIQTLHSSVRCNLTLDDRWIYEVLHMTPFSAKLLWGLIQTVWITTPDAAEPSLRRLHKHLLKDYVMVRPRINASEPVHVTSSFELCNLLGLDGRQGMLESYGYFEHHWRDDFLVWDPAEFDGVDHLRLLTSEVWIPDMGVFNSMSRVSGDTFRSIREFPVQVSSNGVIRWGHATLVESSCDVDMTHFPFDEQTCLIQYGTLNSDMKVVVMDVGVNYVKSNYYHEDGEFIVTSNASYQMITTVEGTTYTSLGMSLTLQRRPTYYILNMVLPCVVLSMLGSLAFCLPVSSGERVSLQITVILSFGIYQMMLTEYIPNHATKIPILSILIECTMLVSALSLIANVYIVSINARCPEMPMSGRTHAVIFRYLGRLVCYRAPPRRNDGSYNGKLHQCGDLGVARPGPECVDLHTSNKGKKSRYGDLHYHYNTNVGEWQAAANVLDRIFVLIFTLMFLVIGIFELST